jgi:hypothetical protein
MLQTEFEFELPKGYVDAEGNVHRKGIMRLATAADEIEPLKDTRVQNNRAYLVIVLLSRVIVRLGDIKHVTTAVIENLFAADLEFLQGFYQNVNDTGGTTVRVACPKCQAPFEVEPYPLASEAIP